MKVISYFFSLKFESKLLWRQYLKSAIYSSWCSCGNWSLTNLLSNVETSNIKYLHTNGKGPVLPGQVCLLQVPKSVGFPLLHNFGSNTRLVSKVFSWARGSNARLP